MTSTLHPSLTPEKALIFRITHRANLPWIFQNGLHCSSSPIQDPSFVSIGNPELIERRQRRRVPTSPAGTLADYVPFYFTPFTPMLFNIVTGYGGIQRRTNAEIVILVSSLLDLESAGVRYVFTDRHAYLHSAEFFGDRADLGRVDFKILQEKDFRNDPEDPGKKERYQAEVLVHRHLPASVLKGVACYNMAIKQEVEAAADEHSVELKTIIRSGWYFR
ncbi:MAG: DUF4433 domain-containing protein [Acidobacteriota bacterium]|nr:DUF4433 domain-containing protein [Acidobacteriota bacterium]